MSAYPIYQQILCVEREIKMRERVYPRFVGQGKMTQAQAEREIDIMRAVLETLMGLQEQGELPL